MMEPKDVAFCEKEMNLQFERMAYQMEEAAVKIRGLCFKNEPDGARRKWRTALALYLAGRREIENALWDAESYAFRIEKGVLNEDPTK